LIDIEHCSISRREVNEALARLRAAPLPDGDYSLRAPGGEGPFFEQTNAAMARELVELVEQTVTRGQQLLVDGYCGSGLFARQLAPLFEKVIGIEENAFAVEHARHAAGPTERYVAGAVETHLGDVLTVHDPRRTTVILDPPAIGISVRVVDLLVAGRVAEVVICVVQSCDAGARSRGALPELSSRVRHAPGHVSADCTDRGGRVIAPRR
jgi:tRNA/tmRNA/rRNA uracil-C5-methylase (TrmA/RlmC/RlmD family)